MRSLSLFENLSRYESLEVRLSPTTLVAANVSVVAADEDDPLPDPEPSPGPYPGEDAPLEYPDPPPSGPVGPGFMTQD